MNPQTNLKIEKLTQRTLRSERATSTADVPIREEAKRVHAASLRKALAEATRKQ